MIAGPAGAPGRSTVALNLAAAAAATGSRTLLIDADTIAPALSTMLGVMTDDPGLAIASRAALDATSDAVVLRSATIKLADSSFIVTGTTGHRHPDVNRPLSIERIVTCAASEFDHVLIDTSSWNAGDTDLGSPGQAAVLRTLLTLADSLVIVGAAEPLGVVRLMAVLASSQHEAPQAEHVVVFNRVRGSALGGADSELAELLAEHVTVPKTYALPDDRAATDTAVLLGQPTVVVQPKSKFSAAFRPFADAVLAAHMPDPSRVGLRAARPSPSIRLGLRRAG